jgi:hypothetical protein
VTEAFRAATWTALSDASYSRNAQAIRDEIATLAGIDQVVALLERLARERQPVPTCTDGPSADI